MQIVKTRCLARRRMVAPFSFERISSGARRREKPRAEGRPWDRDERRFRRWVRISETLARRRIRALEIQKMVRMALSASGVVEWRPDESAFRRSRIMGREEGGRILLTMRAIWRRTARRTDATSSIEPRRINSLR